MHCANTVCLRAPVMFLYSVQLSAGLACPGFNSGVPLRTFSVQAPSLVMVGNSCSAHAWYLVMVRTLGSVLLHNLINLLHLHCTYSVCLSGIELIIFSEPIMNLVNYF